MKQIALIPKDNIQYSGLIVLTFDIECIIISGRHIPHIITIYNGFNPVFTFSINKNSFLKGNYNQEVTRLFTRVIKFLVKYSEPYKQVNIYVHNLGGYDGTFIARELLESDFIDIRKVKILLDKHNKFIIIEYLKIKFLDSCRLSGGLSLKDICKIWKVKTPKLDNKEIWFTKDILLEANSTEYDNLVEYAKVDVVSLFQCITIICKYYYEIFDIDFLNKVSTASLSYGIWSKTHNDNPLPKELDGFCRRGYYGGYTNYLKFAGQNLYQYDANSLYPHAMLNPIPHQVDLDKCFNEDESKPSLESFFGFALARITNPTKYELLPLRLDKLVYPANGSSWIGTYFSEELKFVESIGYKVELIEGLAFSMSYPFYDYIDKLYDLKLSAEKEGNKELRYLAKLHLNSLYGFFGKSLEQYNISITDKVPVSSRDFINIGDRYLVKDLMVNLSSSANVAIAAAVTSYARIHMYKLIHKYYDHLYYVDTDSLFLDVKLDPEEIGDELGLMKDELKGSYIKYGYFLGTKQYWLKLGDGSIKSVFTGVQRNSINEDEVNTIISGGTVSKEYEKLFYHDNNTLNINTKNIKRRIVWKATKTLNGNCYEPIIR